MLGDFLARTESAWRPRPFVGDPLRWRAANPGLAAWTDGLDEADIERLEEADLRSPEVPARLRTWAEEAADLTRVPSLVSTGIDLEPPAHRPPRRVRGRKWQQVHALGSTALHALNGARPSRWVEWCSGKSHLGRGLSRATGVGLTALERDGGLCLAGRAEVADGDPEVRFVDIDIHDPGVGEWVPERAAIVGLHACGDLTDALVRTGAARSASLILAAPCCPQRREDGTYGPMSAAGRARGLALDRPSLLLAVSSEVVGGARILRLRRQAMVWRAAFSALLGSRYYSLPSVPDSAMAGGFRSFAEGWAAHEALDLPTRWDEAATLAEGARRARRARARGLVRSPFRAALELWTVLDRADWLQEQGRDASVGRFCPRAVTPRNLVVVSRA